VNGLWYAGTSPFVYGANNPIKYIDSDGKEIIDPNGKVVVSIDVATGKVIISDKATEATKK
jgi:hypothetical protein